MRSAIALFAISLLCGCDSDFLSQSPPRDDAYRILSMEASRDSVHVGDTVSVHLHTVPKIDSLSSATWLTGFRGKNLFGGGLQDTFITVKATTPGKLSVSVNVAAPNGSVAQAGTSISISEVR